MREPVLWLCTAIPNKASKSVSLALFFLILLGLRVNAKLPCREKGPGLRSTAAS